VATFSYFAMLSGQGWTAIAGCRQFFYARYIDWAITTPLLILDLGLVAGQDYVTIAAVCGADSMGALPHPPAHKHTFARTPAKPPSPHAPWDIKALEISLVRSARSGPTRLQRIAWGVADDGTAKRQRSSSKMCSHTGLRAVAWPSCHRPGRPSASPRPYTLIFPRCAGLAS